MRVINNYLKLLFIFIVLAIVGNKGDMYENEEVEEEEAKAFAKEYNAIFIKTSAKESYGIDDLFHKIGERFLHKELGITIQKKDKNNNNVNINNKKSDVNENSLKKEELINSYKNEIKDLKNKLNDYKNGNEILKNELDEYEKEIKIIKDELNSYKKLKETFREILNKNENKIKNLTDENTKLKNELLKLDKNASNLNINENNDEKLADVDNIISLNFISEDEKINCNIKCLKTDIFAFVEEKLYQKYEELRESNNNFIINGKTVLRFKKICDNDIKDGDIIKLIKIE